MDNAYKTLRAIDVSQHIEKKGQLSYLSWAWAVDQLQLVDPSASWEFEQPTPLHDGTMLVWVSVTVFGKTHRMPLPVMDNRNRAIAHPDAFAVNTAYMRCLTKAIAVHGLGLYIYAGEDLPEEVKEERNVAETQRQHDTHLNALSTAPSLLDLKRAWLQAHKFADQHPEYLDDFTTAKDTRKAQLEQAA